MTTDFLFLAVPMLALFCNVFLLLTFLSAKKNKLIYSFLLLLCSFILWTGGSLFQRLGLYPGEIFWFRVSATGIFCVPYLFYNFIYHYTGKKGNFARGLWFFSWTAIVLLNAFTELFIYDPRIVVAEGSPSLVFSISWFSIIPIVFAVWIISAAIRMIVRNVRHDSAPISNFTPMIFGVIIMFVGVIALSFIPVKGLNSDTLFCGINAVCLYYALYKRRMFHLTQIVSNSPVYFMALAFVSITFTVFYAPISSFLAYFKNYQMLAFAVLFSLFTVLTYVLLRKLMTQLFIKGQQAKDEELKKFSHSVNKTLEISEVVDCFKEFLISNIPAQHAYICVLDEKKGRYVQMACTDDLKAKTISLPEDNPLVNWLASNNQAITYRDFCRTGNYRSMWEKEKEMFRRIQPELILPIVSDSRVVGITFFVNRDKGKGKDFSYTEINFLESAAAILSIAFKNASLYNTLQNEARHDALTELYNRGYFIRKLKQDFPLCAHDCLTVLILSFDDFRLYNELYGVQEGDAMLIAFGEMLRSVVGQRGVVARYSGKEFIVSLPFCDARTAQAIAMECRSRLEHHVAGSNESTKKFLTFSAGICTYPAAVSNLDDLISYANMALYSAKKNGKNRIVVYSRHNADNEDKPAPNSSAEKTFSDNYASTIYALCAAINAKDHYTFNHSNNVSEYATALAGAIGLDSEHVEIIRQAGLLHDIGKIGIPEAILTKNSRLTDEEYEIMKQHVERSIAMIRHLPSLDYVIPAAIGHHERWDGKGYPRGISGEVIPIGARCLCIADAFDAMTTTRSYRNAMSTKQALDEIRRNLGTQFDPKLGMTFIQLVEDGTIIVKPD